jgi:SAM-dependent methyltransferase
MGQAATGYQEDLAYTHDVGHGFFATGAAPGVLELFRQHGITGGLVVDLGCGSGIWARILADARYDVLGIDYSAAMIALARKRAPKATFRNESYLDANLPPCDAVTSIGECFNYLFDRDGDAPLLRLFRRVYAALRPGGLFVFDILEPGQLKPGVVVKGHRVGDDWAVMVEKEEDADRQVLTRRITTFRQVGKLYRRSEEVHRQRLYPAPVLADSLERAGFQVRTQRRYGEYAVGRAHAVLVGRKARESGRSRRRRAAS